MREVNNMQNELQHYGVPGMKWGKRKVVNLQNKSIAARSSAARWSEKAQQMSDKGRTKAATKYANRADRDTAAANKYSEKATNKVLKKYRRGSKLAGYAAFEKEQGDAAYRKHDAAAKALDKTAAKFEKQGSYMKAEAARRSASALRARGESIQKSHIESAERYLAKSEKLNTKASDFANSTNVNVGKKRVNDYIKKYEKKGYEESKAFDEYSRDEKVRNAVGDDGLELYRKIQGRG